MRAAIVGAGASIEIAKQAGVERHLWPPTIANFAEKLWASPEGIGFYNYWLKDYLESLGLTISTDPTLDFIQYEKTHNEVNIEKLFEYCWLHKEDQFEDDYDNLMYHGITNALNDLLIRGFCINNKIDNLQAGQKFAKKLNNGDLVLNLNYDTLFEISAEQANIDLTFIPNSFKGQGISIAKPHGSLNMLVDEEKFTFARPNCIGALPSSGDNLRNHHSIVPPRFNKSYEQHPTAKIIINSIINVKPSTLTFWGVGITSSDSDLIDLYSRWRCSATRIEVINPDKKVAKKISKLLNTKVVYFQTLQRWLCAN